jgi:hypothetical protein
VATRSKSFLLRSWSVSAPASTHARDRTIR